MRFAELEMEFLSGAEPATASVVVQRGASAPDATAYATRRSVLAIPRRVVVSPCAQRVRDLSTCERGCGCCEVAQQVEGRTVSGMSDTSNPVCALLGPRAQQVGILEDTELLVTSGAANQRNDVGIRGYGWRA